jgi:hypothetical protein
MATKLAFLVLAAAALAGAAANGRDLGSIDADAPNAFSDDIWRGGDPLGTKPFARPLWSGPRGCADQLRSCAVTLRRMELLTSTAADASPNRTVDVTGHALSVSGVIVYERAEPSGFLQDFGGATTWSASGELALDNSGTQSWEVLEPDRSPNAKWLPVLPYRFVVSTDALDGPAPQGAVPEASTWELLSLGLAALASAALMRRRAQSRHGG